MPLPRRARRAAARSGERLYGLSSENVVILPHERNFDRIIAHVRQNRSDQYFRP
jgi:hypothetical protein